MASTPTDILRLERQGVGDNPDTWGITLNAVLDRIDEAIAGATSVSTTGGTTTLTDEDYIEDESRKAILLVSGTLASNSTIVIPALTKIYAVSNATTGSFTVTVKTSAGTGVVVPQGTQSFVLCDATDCFLIGGILNVVEDTTPQLGGDLDLNGNVITGLEIGTDVQAYDAQLDSLSSASANGVSLVTAANYAAMRTLLDLEAGTDFYSISAADAAFLSQAEGDAAYQPLDAELTSLSAASANGVSLVTAADYAAMRGLLDLEAGTDFYSISGADAAFQPLDAELTEWAAIDPDAAAITFTNTGLHLLDTNASHDLIIAPGSDLSADRTLTLTTGDADITLNLTDPGADRLMFWDDGAGQWRDLTLTAGLTINGTEIRANESFVIACSDETTDLTTGTAKVTFRMPYAFTLTAVRASVTTAPTGATLIVDINESGTTILSTKLSIDISEETSTTAASAAVISDAALADDAEITIDIDQIGSSTAGAGLKVTLIGYRP